VVKVLPIVLTTHRVFVHLDALNRKRHSHSVCISFEQWNYFMQLTVQRVQPCSKEKEQVGLKERKKNNNPALQRRKSELDFPNQLSYLTRNKKQ
jgi:hypothetical protein